MQKSRFSKQFIFWLNMFNTEESAIADTIATLKEKRLFSQTIRDGIRLITALREHNVSVLLELFPWVEDYFVNYEVSDDISVSQKHPDEVVLQELASIKEMLLTRESDDVAQPTSVEDTYTQESSMIPKSLLERTEDTLSLDDLDLEVKSISHDENNRSDWNFMIASAMQVQGHCNGLPDEIIRYGLHTKRISLKDVPRWGRQIPNVPYEDRPRSKGGPKAMDVSQFESPVFDDIDVSTIAP